MACESETCCAAAIDVAPRNVISDGFARTLLLWHQTVGPTEISFSSAFILENIFCNLSEFFE